MQVVHGEKVVQETGGRLSMPQRVGLRHLKQLGHTFTRSEAVGAQYYNSAKSEKVVARSETGKAHHYTFTRSETVGAQNYTPTRSVYSSYVAFLYRKRLPQQNGDRRKRNLHACQVYVGQRWVFAPPPPPPPHAIRGRAVCTMTAPPLVSMDKNQ